jgi:hypothetical protein
MLQLAMFEFLEATATVILYVLSIMTVAMTLKHIYHSVSLQLKAYV